MKNDGGPAFPVHPSLIMRGNGNQAKDVYDTLPLNAECGMSLRDWFAGMALTGLSYLVIEEDQTQNMRQPVAAVAREQWIAMLSYSFADAMLAERAKESK